MTRRVPQRIILSFVCALALILIPVAYSPAWGQSTTTQQDKTDQNVDQNQDKQDPNQTQTQTNQDPNQTQSNQPAPDVNSPAGTREKPDSSVNDPNQQNQNQGQTEYNQNQNQNQPSTGSQTYSGSQTKTPKSSSTTTTQQSTDQNANQSASNQNLPKTAGELPLILLIGLLSLGAAAGTRLLAHRSSR